MHENILGGMRSSGGVRTPRGKTPTFKKQFEKSAPGVDTQRIGTGESEPHQEAYDFKRKPASGTEQKKKP